ncbi:hypothetical protein PENTCL1PPCAC_16693, partial [Pristionchus entomophagus]
YFISNYVALILHSISVLTAIFVIVVVQSTQLHRNCKFLLSLWATGYISQFAAHATISALNTTMPFLPINKNDPQIRSYLVDVSVGSQLFCESLEIMIATERIISSVDPAEYHISGRSNQLLFLLSFLAFCAAFVQGIICEANLHFLDAIAVFILEMCSLTMNHSAVTYCGRRSAELHAGSSLNARYQVKEACELAISMQRAYLVTFIAKNTFNGIIMLTCYKSDDAHTCVPLLFPLPHYVMEFIYCTELTISSTFLLSSLVINHPRLKLKAKVLLAKIRGSTAVEDVFQPPHLNSAGRAYFDHLRKTWN